MFLTKSSNSIKIVLTTDAFEFLRPFLELDFFSVEELFLVQLLKHCRHLDVLLRVKVCLHFAFEHLLDNEVGVLAGESFVAGM